MKPQPDADMPKKILKADADKFMLRFPPGMRARIAELAEANGRSMNSEIIAIIERNFSDDEFTNDSLANHDSRIEELERKVETLAEEIRYMRHDYDPNPRD